VFFFRAQLSLGQGNGGVPGSQEECPQGYFDPSSLAPRVYVRACYDYQARRDDELSFSVNSVISNVKKAEQGWWVGDLGHLKQHWFPANFVVEIDPPPTASSNSSSFSFTEEGGAAPTQQQHAQAIWIAKPHWEACKKDANVLNAEGDRLWILQIDIPSLMIGNSSINDCNNNNIITIFQYRVGITSEDEATQWKLKIQETGQTASHREDEHRKNERAMRVARELSNLVIYCRSVVFNLESYLRMSERNPSEMSSFPETKAEKLMSAHSNMFLWYHRVQLSRVYPKAQRVDSSNYNPLPLWNMGSQMTALNTKRGTSPCKSTWVGSSAMGTVDTPAYVPGDPKSLGRADPLVLGVRVLAARHLTRNKNKNSIISPNVEVEVLGAEYDNFKNRTRSINDNGFNPVWDEFFDFTVQNPQLALI
ncbi:Phosphoinositide phospholipase C, partial [Caligus rogercresseyi]